MQLDDYFGFLAPNDIRLTGHRIGIESVLYEYIHRSRTPEQIVAHFDSLTLDEVYATILYYLRNRAVVDAYLTAWLEHGQQRLQSQQAANASNPAYPDFQARLQRARLERAARAAATASILDPA